MFQSLGTRPFSLRLSLYIYTFSYLGFILVGYLGFMGSPILMGGPWILQLPTCNFQFNVFQLSWDHIELHSCIWSTTFLVLPVCFYLTTLLMVQQMRGGNCLELLKKSTTNCISFFFLASIWSGVVKPSSPPWTFFFNWFWLKLNV